VRESIISAARELFADPGYGATSYRSIAAAASTSESALFRHFGTKAALVHESVFEPMVQAYSTRRERWTTVSADTPAGGQPSYLLVEMYRFFRTQRAQLRLLMGLAHDGAYSTLNEQVQTWFGEALRGLAPNATDTESQAHISSLVAMALAAATLDDWFLPHEPAELTTHDIETTLNKIASEGRDNTT
jgi:AcrR family transcriptional regulator